MKIADAEIVHTTCLSRSGTVVALGGFSFRALSYENKAERQREWRENVNAPPNLTAFCRIL